jgi:transposase
LPRVDELYAWIHDLHPRLVPSTPLYVATQYAINQEEAWRRCFTEGRFEIDNGEVERQIRRVALGSAHFAHREHSSRAIVNAWIGAS